jgi:hypothetical protein
MEPSRGREHERALPDDPAAVEPSNPEERTRSGGETPIETLASTTRTATALRVAGVDTVETLHLLTSTDLRHMRRLGLKGAVEIRDVLAAQGFSIRSGGAAPAIDENAAEFVGALGSLGAPEKRRTRSGRRSRRRPTWRRCSRPRDQTASPTRRPVTDFATSPGAWPSW